MRQARVLAQATSDLVNAMRSDAEAEVDVDNSKKLLAAAKLLADATARMVEAAKVKMLPTEGSLLLYPCALVGQREAVQKTRQKVVVVFFFFLKAAKIGP